MSARNLDAFFAPRSVALIGASRRDHAVGQVVAANLFAGGFDGPIMPVNPHETEIDGIQVYRDVASLPVDPDLAVVGTPAASVPQILLDLGKRRCRAAVVLTAGFEAEDAAGAAAREAIRAAGRESHVRIIGPNCLGVMAPHGGVNASFGHVAPLAGRIACVMQSGALTAAMLDWAAARGVGFSKLVSLGDAVDVDFGDMLDYLATDAETDLILLYIEGITHARKFMAAARAAARVKPIVALKAGRSDAAAKAAKSHTGALAGADRVYDAALRRAGIVRVDTLDQLFDAAAVLNVRRPVAGERVALITNGGGIGILATDALVAKRCKLATLSPETVGKLDKLLPPCWSHGNPVDIIGDARGSRYAAVLQAVAGDPGVDALLVLNCPTAVASSVEAADAVASSVTNETGPARGKPVIACWIGDHAAAEARDRLSRAGVPTFATPEQAVDGFSYLLQYQRNRAQLAEVGGSQAATTSVDLEAAHHVLRPALERGQEWLDEVDSKKLLTAYSIPVAGTKIAMTPQRVAEIASETRHPVVLKIRSPDITHKSDVGGVAVDLDSPWEAMAAAEAMLARIRAAKPAARIEGFVVEEWVKRPGSVELIAGLASDPTFGPIVLFGQGGIAVKEIDDTAVALPPLGKASAADLISRTRVSRLIDRYRNHPAADLGAIENVLIRLSRIAADHPEVAELDINPLLADQNGVIALDARIRLRDPALAVPAALTAYPPDLERRIIASDGSSILIRPIRPEDAPALQRFIEGLDPAAVRARFFETMKRLPPGLLDRLTQIDYDREMAFVALDSPEDSDDDAICGVARLIVLPGGAKGEYALTASRKTIERGIARALMSEVIAYARRRGLTGLCGGELRDSADLLGLARDLGGTITQDPEDATLACVALNLFPVEEAA
jgi:acetyltransferase